MVEVQIEIACVASAGKAFAGLALDCDRYVVGGFSLFVAFNAAIIDTVRANGVNDITTGELLVTQWLFIKWITGRGGAILWNEYIERGRQGIPVGEPKAFDGERGFESHEAGFGFAGAGHRFCDVREESGGSARWFRIAP